MKRVQKLIAAGVVLGGLAVGGVAVANSSEREAAGPLTPAEVESRKLRDEPLPVMDPTTGVGSGGTVRDSQLREQDDRVDERLATLGISGSDPRWDEAARAAMVLDAVPVLDEGGKAIGYFGTQFIPAADYDVARSAAQATIDRLSK